MPITPWLLPWKPPQKPMNSNFLVTDLASRKAASTASAPPENNCRWVIPSGSSEATRLRKRARVSVVKLPKVDPFELLLEALDVVGMAMADAADRDAGDEVEIFVAVDVGDRAALGVVDDDLREERDRLQPRRHGLRPPRSKIALDLGPGTARRLERVVRGRDFVQRINSLLRRPGAGAAGSARSGNRRSPARRDRGRARSSATR